MPRLKICLASLAPFLGGAEVAVERLAQGLVGEGHDVFLVLGNRGEVMERMQQAGLRCTYSPMPFTDKWHWWHYLRARNALRRILHQEQADIVHSNDLPTNQIVSDAARGLGMPRICHHRFPFEGSAIDWLNKFGAERHLFVSEALMHEMCENSARLAASHRSVVYDGLPLPPNPESKDRRQARCQLGLRTEKVLVTFAGQIIERKGVADLLNAWKMLDPRLSDQAELLIIGDDLKGGGQYRAAMQQLAAEINCPARFLGFQKDVTPWLIASDVAVVPSHVEPLGNATLEAMSYGLPVIGCEVGGIPEMVVHEKTGLLVPPRSPQLLAAAITRLIGDGDLRTRLGDEGRNRCEKLFSLQAHVRSVLAEYTQAIRGDVAPPQTGPQGRFALH